jgi:hypothetical protein
MVEEQDGLEIKLAPSCKSKQEAKDLLKKAFGSSEYISETKKGIKIGGLLMYVFNENEQQNLELVRGFRNPSVHQNIARTYQMLAEYGYAKILGKISSPYIKKAYYYDNLATKVKLCYQYGLKFKDLKPTWFRTDLSLKRLRHVLKDKFGKQLYL